MNNLIDILSRDADIKKAVKNICKGHELWEDLYQELFIILANYDREKLQLMYDNKQIKWFIVRIVMNQWNSTTSPFYKQYRSNSCLPIVETILNVPVSDYDIETDFDANEEKIALKIALNELSQSEKIAFNLYHTKFNSYRKMAKATGVSAMALNLLVKSATKKIKDNEYVVYITN